MAASALALFLWLPDFDKRFLICFILTGALALGLAAVQVIPTIEWLGLLGPQLDNPQPVLDRHQGQGLFSRDVLRDPNSAGISIPEGSAYVGMLGLLAACLAPFHKARSYVLFFAAMALVAIAVAFGFQPVRWIVVHLPIIKAMKNARLILVADFAIAALAGLGISAIEAPDVTLRRTRAVAYLSVAILVVSLCIYELHRATLSPVEFMRSPSGSLIFLLAAAAILAMRLNGRIDARRFSFAVIVFCAVEMLTFSYGYLGFTPTNEVFPPAPVFEFLHSRSDLRNYRVAKDRFPIPHDAGIIYGFEAADGYDLTTERTRKFTADLAEDRPDGVMLLAEKIVPLQDRRLDMLNVKYLLVSAPGPQADLFSQTSRFSPVYSDRSVSVFENPTALPRVWLVPITGVEIIPDENAQLQRIKQASFAPQESVVFGSAPIMLGPVGDVGGNAPNSFICRDTGKNFEYLPAQDSRGRANSCGPQSDVLIRAGKATANGRNVPVYPVDYALSGIVLNQTEQPMYV